MQSEARVSPESSPSQSLRVEKQRVVRSNGDDEQHPDQMQYRQWNPKQRQRRGHDEDREHERREHSRDAAGRSQGDQQKYDDGERPRQGQAHGVAQVVGVERV